MVFGARGPCGQHVRPVAVRALGRGNDLAIAQLHNMAASHVVARKKKLEIAATGRVQVKIARNKRCVCLLSSKNLINQWGGFITTSQVQNKSVAWHASFPALAIRVRYII